MLQWYIGQIGIFILLAGITSLVKAETITPTNKTDEIIVTATRAEKDIKQVPANITVISEDDIKRSNAQSIPEILKTEPGLMVSDYTGSGKTVNVDIRGFGETGPLNTLVLIDGRRVTEDDLSATDWTQIPLDNVSRIEIIRGAGSVLYGNNAAGGVINIITKKGVSGFSAQVNNYSGSYNANNFSFNSKGGNNDFYFSINQNYRTTDGYRENSYLESQDSNAKLGMTLSPDLNLELSLGVHNDRYGLPGYLTPAQITLLGRRATKNPDDNGQTDDYYYNLRINKTINTTGHLSLDASIRNRQNIAVYMSMGGFKYQGDLKSVQISPRYLQEFSIGEVPTQLTLGMDVVRDNANLGSTNAIKESTGSYLLLDSDIQTSSGSTNKGFDIVSGYRREKAFYTFVGGTFDVRKTLTEDVFSIGLSRYAYQQGCLYMNGSFYVNYSKSFRNPSLDEYFSQFTGLNASLKAQKGEQVEAGVKISFADYWLINVTRFSNLTDKEIYLNPLTYANENYDRIARQGTEFETKFLPYKAVSNFPLGIILNYTSTEAEFRKGQFKGNDVPGVPAGKGGVTIITSGVIDNLEMSLSYRYVGKRYLISDMVNAQKPLPAYDTLEIKFAYDYRKLKMSFGVNNILNEKYAEYGAYYGLTALYPSPERNYSFGLALEF